MISHHLTQRCMEQMGCCMVTLDMLATLKIDAGMNCSTRLNSSGLDSSEINRVKKGSLTVFLTIDHRDFQPADVQGSGIPDLSP